MAEKQAQAVKKVRFFRSDLETIVWDEDKNKRVIFDEKNQFATSDPYLIAKLTRFGYPQVPLDAEAPPPIPIRPVEEIGDIRILPRGASEQTELQKHRRETLLKEDTGEKPLRKIKRRGK